MAEFFDSMIRNFDKLDDIIYKRPPEVAPKREQPNKEVGQCECIHPPSDPLIQSMVYEGTYCTCGKGKKHFDPRRRMLGQDRFKDDIRNGPVPFTAPPNGEPHMFKDKPNTAPIKEAEPDVTYKRGVLPGSQYEQELFSMAIRQKVYKDRYIDPKTGNVFTFDVQVDSRGMVLGDRKFEGKI